jgi:branched-chain amino acid transport system permease protein
LALNSIREDEDVSQTFGINPYQYKTLALMLSSVFASFMGAIYMFYITYIIPDMVFGLELIFSPAIMAMLGGTGTLFGPIMGAVFITLLQEILWTRLAYLHLTIYGMIFAMVGLFLPGGILREPKVRYVLGRVFKV